MEAFAFVSRSGTDLKRLEFWRPDARARMATTAQVDLEDSFQI